MRIDTTVALAPDGTVDLTLISGTIRVTAWARSQARVVATTERGNIIASYGASRLSLETRSQRGRLGDTRYEVTVPAGARVMMRTVSGEVTAAGVRGDIEAHTVSGDIDVRDAGGRLDVQSVSGEIDVAGVRGDVDAHSVSGDVMITGASAGVDAETVSGEIGITSTGGAVRTTSVSGSIDYAGPLRSGVRYGFTSHSGSIRLVLPLDASARLSVETFSGSFDSDFPITLSPASSNGSRRRRMEFSLGSGAALVDARSFSGTIHIERADSTAGANNPEE